MGIVTGRPEAEVRWTVDRLGWKRYFPLVVAREKQEGRGKPDPFPLQHALGILKAAGMHVEPEEAVYIGDTVDDMVAARAAGVGAIGYVPPYADADEMTPLLQQRGAQVVLRDLDELPGLLEQFHTYLAPGEAGSEVA